MCTDVLSEGAGNHTLYPLCYGIKYIIVTLYTVKMQLNRQSKKSHNRKKCCMVADRCKIMNRGEQQCKVACVKGNWLYWLNI